MRAIANGTAVHVLLCKRVACTAEPTVRLQLHEDGRVYIVSKTCVSAHAVAQSGTIKQLQEQLKRNAGLLNGCTGSASSTLSSDDLPLSRDVLESWSKRVKLDAPDPLLPLPPSECDWRSAATNLQVRSSFGVRAQPPMPGQICVHLLYEGV